MKLALLATLLVAACGGGGNLASHSPSPASSASAEGSSSPSSQPSAGATPASTPTTTPVSSPYGLLVGAQGGSSYTVSLVGIDARVVAADATTPPVVSCANAAGAPVPLPVSTSNSRAYFMDAQGVVHFLAPDGTTGRATSVPAPTASRRATFAVSPDDQRIAVVVVDYSATGASTRLYAEDLNGGGNHVNLFTESGARSLWAVGWHGTNNLVLAVVPSCTQGGGPFCCGMLELHVVDPATATRRFTLGGPACVIAGPPSPQGVACYNSTYTEARGLTWTGSVYHTWSVSVPYAEYLSPRGDVIAVPHAGNGDTTLISGRPNVNMVACGWIDDAHLLAGGDAQSQPRMADLNSDKIVPIAAQGDCGGRLPGGL
jgi:hypothetical protein